MPNSLKTTMDLSLRKWRFGFRQHPHRDITKPPGIVWNDWASWYASRTLVKKATARIERNLRLETTNA